jgi:hypothetical protein
VFQYCRKHTVIRGIAGEIGAFLRRTGQRILVAGDTAGENTAIAETAARCRRRCPRRLPAAHCGTSSIFAVTDGRSRFSHTTGDVRFMGGRRKCGKWHLINFPLGKSSFES